MTRLRLALAALVVLSFATGFAHASVEDQLAEWIPAPILAALVLSGFVALAKWLAKRLDSLETAIAGLHAFATKDDLAELAQRVDAGHSQLRERVAVVEASFERVEE